MCNGGKRGGEGKGAFVVTSPNLIHLIPEHLSECLYCRGALPSPFLINFKELTEPSLTIFHLLVGELSKP